MLIHDLYAELYTHILTSLKARRKEITNVFDFYLKVADELLEIHPPNEDKFEIWIQHSKKLINSVLGYMADQNYTQSQLLKIENKIIRAKSLG